MDIKQVITKAFSDHQGIELAAKAGVGFGGAGVAMTVNDIAGLVVALLTAIYMAFQIEAAIAKRRERIKKAKNDKGS